MEVLACRPALGAATKLVHPNESPLNAAILAVECFVKAKARKTSARRYPSQWERHVILDLNWRIFLRPIRPNDDTLIRDLFAHVSREDLRLRFFNSIKEVSPALMSKLTRLDYSRAMAFVAIDESDGHTLGIVRLHTDEEDKTAEYAIVIRSDLKGRGLGWLLMQLIIEYAKSENLKGLHGEILQENAVMLKMCQSLGFQIKTNTGDRGLRHAHLIL